jgi:type VI secretion system protein
MPLTLTIQNRDQLENGSPISLILDRRGALIGRDPTTDWCLPDPSLHISSRHCEIEFRDDSYVINDISTNGTFLNGASARLPGPHVAAPGDVLVIGPFQIAVSLDAQTAAAMNARNAAPAPAPWKGWESSPGSAASAAPAASMSQWDAPPPSAAISGSGPMSQNWAAPKVEAPLAPDHDPASTWGTPAPSVQPASQWSSPVADAPAAPAAADVWGNLAASNVVDWARGGFGATPEPAVAPQAVAFAPVQAPAPPPPPAAAPAPAPRQVSIAPSPLPQPSPAAPTGLSEIVKALGLSSAELKQDDAATLTQANHVLRRIVAGLVVMLEARARAKSQMGAQGTSLSFDGNNPLKFARTPEQALAQLLNPPERGFMSADQAVEDAFRDLQAHQLATLKAMQGALRATLDRFSPTAIRARAKKAGVFAKIMPGAKDAALWQTYEREFSGVAQGSDEAFMDIFAKEFRKAYDEAANGR